jgi:predicted site-specific integrase-resolvase
MNGPQPTLSRASDATATIIIAPTIAAAAVEHRDRHARFGVEHIEAGLSAEATRSSLSSCRG